MENVAESAIYRQTTEALPPGWRLLAFEDVESTNTTLRRLIDDGIFPQLPHGLVCVAESQSAGRGRAGRLWHSPKGNLYHSVVLDVSGCLARAGQVGFMASVALVESIATLMSGLEPKCKWPNDVLVQGHKVNGVLLETVRGPNGEDGVIIGMGVNLTSAPPQVPDMMFPPAALSDFGMAPGADALMATLLPRLAVLAELWRVQGFAPIRQAWKNVAYGLGEGISVRQQGKEGEARLQGVFRDLDKDGALLIETPDGIQRILAGDVYF